MCICFALFSVLPPSLQNVRVGLSIYSSQTLKISPWHELVFVMGRPRLPPLSPQCFLYSISATFETLKFLSYFLSHLCMHCAEGIKHKGNTCLLNSLQKYTSLQPPHLSVLPHLCNDFQQSTSF